MQAPTEPPPPLPPRRRKRGLPAKLPKARQPQAPLPGSIAAGSSPSVSAADEASLAQPTLPRTVATQPEQRGARSVQPEEDARSAAPLPSVQPEPEPAAVVLEPSNYRSVSPPDSREGDKSAPRRGGKDRRQPPVAKLADTCYHCGKVGHWKVDCPMILTVQPTAETTRPWTFACVLGPAVAPRGPEEEGQTEAELHPRRFEDFVAQQCRVFATAGFTLGVCERTPQTADRVIVLLSMDSDRVLKEFRRLQIERWKETGAGVEFQLVSDASEREKRAAWGESHTSSSPICEKLHPTIADEVQVQAQVLTHRCGLGDLEHLHDRYSRRPDRRIHAVFPLKDRRWETDFAMRWAKDGGVVKSCKLISREFHALGNDLKLETRAALAQAQHQSRRAVHAARDGARSAGQRAHQGMRLVHKSALLVHKSALNVVGQVKQGVGSRSVRSTRSADSASPTFSTDEPSSPGSSDDSPVEVISPRSTRVRSRRESLEGIAKKTMNAAGRTAHGAMRAGVKGASMAKNVGVKSAHYTVEVAKGCGLVLWKMEQFVYRLAQAFWTRDDEFVNALQYQYGDRIGIYFAFVNNYSNSLMPLGVLLLLFFFVGRYALGWHFYLRGIGLIGMMVASVWGPAVIALWRRRSDDLLFSWKMMDTKELPEPNPYCDPKVQSSRKRTCLMISLLMLLVLVLVVFLFLANLALIAFETQLLWAPVCGSYMETILGQSETLLVKCLHTTGLEPWSGDRGFYILLTGIVTGLLIDVVYTEVFNLVAEAYVQALHIPTKTDYESTLVNIMFPFHWGAFMFYFLLLALYVPFGPALTEETLDLFGIGSEDDVIYGPNSTLASSDYWKFWNYQKRYLLELDTAMVGPLVIAVWLEFAFGQIMPWLGYLRTKYLVQRRGTRLGRWAWVWTRLSCCCRSDNIGIGGDAVVSDIVTEAVTTSSYLGFAQRLQQQVGHPIVLVSGRWYCTPQTRFKDGLKVLMQAQKREQEAYELGRTQCQLQHSTQRSQRSAGTNADSDDSDDSSTESDEEGRADVSGLVAALHLYSLGLKHLESAAADADELLLAATSERCCLCCHRRTWQARLVAELRHARKQVRSLQGKVARATNGQAMGAGNGALPDDQPVHAKKPQRPKPIRLPPLTGPVKDAAAPMPRLQDDLLQCGSRAGGSSAAGADGSGTDPVLSPAIARHAGRGMVTRSTSAQIQVADDLLLESELPLFDLHFEYLQIVQQFAYVTMFTVLWALAPMMNLTRNVLEAQVDAQAMFKYHRRAVPCKPGMSQKTPIGSWETMMWLQVYFACVSTSAFFVFCTGEMEAWVLVFQPDLRATQTELMEGTWSGCQPIADTSTIDWTFPGEVTTNTSSGCLRPNSTEPWDLPDMVTKHPAESFLYLMAPNLDCWEDTKVNNSLPLCQQPASAAGAGRISFQQAATRLLIWLFLNHVQLFTCIIVSYAMLNTKSKRVQVKLDTHAREQKEMLALAVFQEDAKSVASWRRSRHSIRSLQRTRRRIRVQSLDSNDPSLLVRDKEVEAERKRRQRAATIMHSFDVESPRSARSDETRGVDQRMAVLEEATDSEEEYDGPSIEARHVAEP